jgi:D-serine deaminase-like pyridoxal phosphate-dependent protein
LLSQHGRFGYHRRTFDYRPGVGTPHRRLAHHHRCMQDPPARVGMTLDAIDTPALIVDLEPFERNLQAMARFARDAGMRLRPHAKTHKCPAIAKMQIAAGAVGQCCQKVGEAEAMVAGGVADVLVSNEVVDPDKLRRLAALARKATIALCFDAPGPVDAASRAAVEAGVELGALVEIEVGMQRCGIAPGAPAASLAQRIAAAPGLRFMGLQAYHGSAQHLPSAAAREHAIANAAGAVRATRDALAAVGLSCERVSGGGTGTYRLESASGCWNELQVGSYLFMDTDYARIGAADGKGARYTDFAHSLYVLASVISTQMPTRAIVDAGLKSMSGEKGPPWVLGREDIEVASMSDEHCRLELRPGAAPLALGERVRLIPGHCDPTVNLHDWYVAVRGDRVEALWPISARGASR